MQNSPSTSFLTLLWAATWLQTAGILPQQLRHSPCQPGLSCDNLASIRFRRKKLHHPRLGKTHEQEDPKCQEETLGRALTEQEKAECLQCGVINGVHTVFRAHVKSLLLCLYSSVYARRYLPSKGSQIEWMSLSTDTICESVNL